MNLNNYLWARLIRRKSSFMSWRAIIQSVSFFRTAPSPSSVCPSWSRRLSFKSSMSSIRLASVSSSQKSVSTATA